MCPYLRTIEHKTKLLEPLRVVITRLNVPPSKSFSSVNVTGVQGTGTTTTKTAAVIPQAMTSSPSVAPLAKIRDTKATTTTNVPTVLKPLLGGTCPTGYRLVSGTVCIKDLPPNSNDKNDSNASNNKCDYSTIFYCKSTKWHQLFR
jgi:hypothetical protein